MSLYVRGRKIELWLLQLFVGYLSWKNPITFEASVSCAQNADAKIFVTKMSHVEYTIYKKANIQANSRCL